MISSPPSEMLVQKVSDNVKLNCSSSGSPLPKVKWLKNGKVISKAGYSAMDLTMSELIIPSFKPSDTGLYTCRFYNSKNSSVEASTNLGMSNSYPVYPEAIRRDWNALQCGKTFPAYLATFAMTSFLPSLLSP